MTQQPQVRSIVTREIFGVALETFRRYKVRFTLTALGVTIGTASVILVVTIGLTGKEYILNQIRGIGSNLIYAIHEVGEGNAPVLQDFLTMDDLRALQQQVRGVVAASPLAFLNERIPIGRGKEQNVRVLGADPQYRQIRNLDVRAQRGSWNEWPSFCRNHYAACFMRRSTSLWRRVLMLPRVWRSGSFPRPPSARGPWRLAGVWFQSAPR